MFHKHLVARSFNVRIFLGVMSLYQIILCISGVPCHSLCVAYFQVMEDHGACQLLFFIHLLKNCTILPGNCQHKGINFESKERISLPITVLENQTHHSYKSVYQQ